MDSTSSAGGGSGSKGNGTSFTSLFVASPDKKTRSSAGSLRASAVLTEQLLDTLRAERLRALMKGDVQTASELTARIQRGEGHQAGGGGMVATRRSSRAASDFDEGEGIFDADDDFDDGFDEGDRNSSSLTDPTAFQLFECGADAFDSFCDAFRLLAFRLDELLTAMHKADEWLNGLESHFDSPDFDAKSMATGGAKAVLEGPNKEGLDFIDALFDDLHGSKSSTSNNNGLDEGLELHDVAKLLDRLRIKDVITPSEIEEVFLEFHRDIDDHNAATGQQKDQRRKTGEGGSEPPLSPDSATAGKQVFAGVLNGRFDAGNGIGQENEPMKTVDRVGFHALLRWLLHYLMMITLTDLVDDQRFMFSHLEELVKFARGKGGAGFLAKRFNRTPPVQIIAEVEKKGSEQELERLRKKVRGKGCFRIVGNLLFNQLLILLV